MHRGSPRACTFRPARDKRMRLPRFERACTRMSGKSPTTRGPAECVGREPRVVRRRPSASRPGILGIRDEGGPIADSDLETTEVHRHTIVVAQHLASIQTAFPDVSERRQVLTNRSFVYSPKLPVPKAALVASAVKSVSSKPFAPAPHTITFLQGRQPQSETCPTPGPLFGPGLGAAVHRLATHTVRQ